MKNSLLIFFLFFIFSCSKDNSCDEYLVHTFWEYKSNGNTVPNTTKSSKESFCGDDKSKVYHGYKITISENATQRYVKYYN